MESRSREQLAGLRGRAALLAAAALVASGCGGSSKTQPTNSTNVAKSTESHTTSDSAASRLIAKADAICRRLNKELAATGSANSEARQLARSAPRHASLERRAVAELRALTPPSSLAADWRQIVVYRQTLAEELAKLGRYAKANDTRAVQSLGASKKRVHQKLNELATRAGFKDCSTIGAPRGIGQLFRSFRSPRRPGAHT